MDQYIGKYLDDRYEILEEIGSGGMAVVYKARCHRLNRLVAVKILRPNMMLDDDIRRRFHNESQAVAMLSSPNIVSVYDVGQFEGADYIVMELIEGITLKEYMQKRGGVLDWREALHFTTQIMQALRHAHSRGIVHRDIKPQNIMVLRDGSVKVADFGIARIMDSQKTLTTEAFGSVHYVSPEQAKGLSVDARSDIYSAGVVLYEMLTGQLPFDGDTPVSIALQHINATPTPPRKLNPRVPEGMEQICKQCMCARLELRYADAKLVLKDLEEFRRNPNIVFPYADPWDAKTKVTDCSPNSDHPQPAAPVSSVRTVSQAEQEPGDGELEFENTAALEAYEDQQRKKARIIYTCAIVAIVGVIIAICFMLYQNFLEDILDTGDVYEVPSLSGMTVDEAKELIATELGGHFEVVISSTEYDDSVEAGDIISQAPSYGSTTKSDLTTISVVVSSGVLEDDSIYMPNLIRKDYRTAEAELENDYGVVVTYGDRVYSDIIDEGLIVSTDPVSGSVLEEGQTVILYVSKGPETRAVSMPNLVGMDLEEAREALESIGLTLGDSVTVAGSRTAGEIIYQSVKYGSEVDPGTEVHVQISDGSLSSGNSSDDADSSTGGSDASSNDSSAEQTSTTPVYEILIPLHTSDEDAGTTPTVSVTINGEVILNMTYSADATQASTVYSGEISDIIVLIDGVQTNVFTCEDISE
ncbi:MAG: Stk1 family PASTA domain-containing Ser/Thr kinase [Clostridiales bacterium]|nr:Stk1 family PASTA domain-containing Ser/Thr kinase [Clostridiales bacterium]